MPISQKQKPESIEKNSIAPAGTLRVGTLSYTRMGLANVFIWMLWGDLCLNIMESIVPRVAPMQLSHLGASNALIGILTGSLFSLMNWLMNPIISTWSDRFRSRMGRRMPFIIYPMPPLLLFLVMVGFSANIAGWLQSQFPGAARVFAAITAAILPDVSSLPLMSQLGIGALAVGLVSYKFFDLFPQCTYYYLFADIIPSRVMGTFVCMFRLVATLGGMLFHYFLLPYAESHPRTLYIGCAALYFFAFTMLALMVKEGKYPQPAPRSGNPVKGTILWIRQSYGRSFYWKYYLSFACSRWAFVPFNTFVILYAQRQLGMNLGDFGHLIAFMMATQVPVFLGLGPILDKFHPVRVGIVGYAILTITSALGFFLIEERQTFLIFTGMVFVANAVVQGALSTLGPRLLPRSHYGQFAAANAMFSESGMVILVWLCGKLLDRTGEQYIYLWQSCFALCGVAAIYLLYRAWLKLGGDQFYLPPRVPEYSDSAE